MSDEKPIVYEPHPVTAERKAELIAAGFRIIDAAFKPAEIQSPPDLDLSDPQPPIVPAKSPEPAQAKRGRPTKP